MTSPANDQWTIRRVLEWTRQYFVQQSIPNPRLEADVLLAYVLKKTRISLYLIYDAPLQASELATYRQVVRERASRRPLSYITGNREFWSLDFIVNPDVLIPRPETELLIEETLALAKNEKAPSRICDVGTGSGCVVIALATELQHADFVATDVSAKALAVAEQNAKRHGVDNRIDFSHGPLIPKDAGIFDLIVSNPPYIPTERLATLMPEVKDHEPQLALDGGNEGLTVIDELISASVEHLEPSGVLMFEFDGRDQLESLTRSCSNHSGLELDRIRDDYSGHPRIAILRRR